MVVLNLPAIPQDFVKISLALGLHVSGEKQVDFPTNLLVAFRSAEGDAGDDRVALSRRPEHLQLPLFYKITRTSTR